MVKVVMLTYYSFLEVQGGAPLYTHKIAEYLAEKGFEVVVFCRGRKQKNVEIDYNGVKVKQYGKLRFDYTKYHRIIDRNIFYISTIKKDFDKECKTSDVIHLISSNFLFPLGYMKKNKKIVTSIIENVINEEDKFINKIFSYYQKWQFGLTLKYSNIVTVPSESFLDYVKEKCPQFHEKLRLIPGFMDTSIFTPFIVDSQLREAYKNKILFLSGSLAWGKGFDIAIKAFEKVIDEFPETKMLIAGNGPLKGELQKLTEDLGIEKHVEFLGELNHYRDMPRYYALADIIVVPSRVEAGQPSWSAAEPMAMEKPVIISEANDIKGVLGDSVIRFKNDDSDNLASKIIYLLEDQDVAKKIGKKARKKILERYSLEKFLKAYDEIYTSLLS